MLPAAMTEQVALECENGHALTGECNESGDVTAVRMWGRGHGRGVKWHFAECTFCPECGAELRIEHGSEIGVKRAGLPGRDKLSTS